jgi:hypothetical protein
VHKLIEVNEETYYTIKDLVDGFVVSKSSVYEMMLHGLRYSCFGGKRIIKGHDLKEYLIEQTQINMPKYKEKGEQHDAENR